MIQKNPFKDFQERLDGIFKAGLELKNYLYFNDLKKKLAF